MIFIRSRTPLYILPAMLLIALIGCYVILLRYKIIEQLAINTANQQIAAEAMSVKVQSVQDKLDRTADKTHLLGVLHNENFAALASGDGQFIYIGRDWNIDEMPHRVRFDSEELREAFRQKFMKLSLDEDEEVVQPECVPQCCPRDRWGFLRPIRRFFHRPLRVFFNNRPILRWLRGCN